MASSLRSLRALPIPGSMDSPVLCMSTYINALVLAAAVAGNLTIPAGAKYMRLSATAFSWLNTEGAVAVAPAGAVVDGSAPLPIVPNLPYLFDCRDFAGGTVSMISTPGATVAAEFWG